MSYKLTKVTLHDERQSKYQMVPTGSVFYGDLAASPIVGERFHFGRGIKDSIVTSPVKEIQNLTENNMLIKTMNSIYLLEEVNEEDSNV